MDLTPDQEQFLRDHHLAVLATGRRDGSPQISTMGYVYDGSHVLMSVTTERAKWHNVARQPKVAMVVNEGQRQLVLYGTTERVADDPERVKVTRALRDAFNMEVPADDAAFAAQLDADKRVILRITPDKVTTN